MLFNQQQCFIYSTASFLSKLRAKKVEKLHNSSFYRKIRKWNTEIRFRDRKRLFPVLPIIIKKKKKMNPDRLTLDFFLHVTVNTHIFFFGLAIQPRFTLFDLHGGFGLGFWCLMPLIYNINYMILYLFITINFKI